MTQRLLIAVCAALVAVPLAADPVTIHATSEAVDKSQFVPTGEASGVLNFLFDFAPHTSGDPEDPLAGAAGPCFGLGKMAAGVTSGEGYCNFADAKGDMMVIHWAMEPTVKVRGSWQFVGGTGKWLAAAGGGYFYDTPPEGQGKPTTTFVGQVEFN